MSEPTAGHVTFHVALREPAPRAGEPVWLVIDLVNGSEGALELPRWSAWFDQQYDIRGPGGRELRRTAFGNEEYKRVEVQAQESVRLAPGATSRSEVLVSRLFDMSLAGPYRVALTRDVRDLIAADWLTLHSNALEFVLSG